MHSTEPQLSGKGDTLGSLQFNSNKASGNSKNVNASSKAGRTDFLFILFLRAGVLSSLQEVLGMGGFFGYITFSSFDQISSGTRVTFSGGASLYQSYCSPHGWVCSEEATHLIKHVRLTELGFEVGRAGQDEPGHVDLVPGDEELHGRLGHLAHVVVPLLHAQAGEAQGRLTPSACREGWGSHQGTQQYPQDTAGPK